MSFVLKEQEIKVEQSLKQVTEPLELAQKLLQMIYDRPILEASARDEDVVLAGIFDFMSNLLSKFDQVR